MSVANPALNDEIEALNSIYGLEALLIDSVSHDQTTRAVLKLPDAPFSFNLAFPSTYPDVPPVIAHVHHVGAETKKGEGEKALEIIRDVLGQTFTPGQVCLFDLIEEASPLFLPDQETTEDNHGTIENVLEGASNRSATSIQDNQTELDNLITSPAAATSPTTTPKWVLSEPLIVNKSTFVARSLEVKSLSEATNSLSHLLSTNKKVASATHNITAWRIKQQQMDNSHAPEIVIQDCDDDGETAAGGRLLHLMQLMDVWNCVVVVTRWYGGVKLGPDRFRCINAVARESLLNAGLVREEKDAHGSKGGKAKKK